LTVLQLFVYRFDKTHESEVKPGKKAKYKQKTEKLNQVWLVTRKITIFELCKVILDCVCYFLDGKPAR